MICHEGVSPSWQWHLVSHLFMSAHYFKENGMICVVNLADIYRFEGYTFEWHRYCGPMLCRKDMEPRKSQPSEHSRFWKALARWEKLSKAEKEMTRIYG